MTTMVSLVADVTDYIFTQCQANPSLGAKTPPVMVLDGEPPNESVYVAPQILWVGFDPVNSSTETGGADQVFAFLDQARTRDETGYIIMAAEDWSGDTNFQVHRDNVKTLVGAVEIMLRGSPGLGPGDATMGGLVQWSQVQGPYTWHQYHDGNGAHAMCVFTITYFARLTA
jgi:hypothetical protein